MEKQKTGGFFKRSKVGTPGVQQVKEGVAGTTGWQPNGP